ncbi:MAG: ATP-binding protein [Hymenobacter sp.]
MQLLTEAGDDDQRQIFLQMLTTSTEKLAETIVNLNDIITVNSNFNKLREPRRLRAEIEKTLEALSVLIRQHHIVVEVAVPADMVVTVVPAYLDSILLNLISNAVKYRDPARPAVIRLATSLEPDYVVLTVRDNGRGLDLAKNRTKLFGMYKTFHNNEDARG